MDCLTERKPFSFPLVVFKEIIEKLFFLTGSWPGAGSDEKKEGIKGGQQRSHYKAGFISMAWSPTTSNSPTSAQWVWLHIWSTVCSLTRLAKLHLPVRKRYAFGQGDASARDVRGKSLFDVTHNSQHALISFHLATSRFSLHEKPVTCNTFDSNLWS